MDSIPDKRERILLAASRLIVRNGLQCSMAAIAEEAGVATGSLYNYFDSKEALVRGVYGRVAEEMTAFLSQPPAGDTPAEHLRWYIETYIDFIWADWLRARLFDYLDNTPLISLADAHAIFGPFVDSADEMVGAAQASGDVRPGSPSLLISFVRGAIRNTLKRRRQSAEPLTEADRALIAAMCWDALSA